MTATVSIIMGSESDLDLLTEKYPNSYREMYREEEETWKMKPLAHPSHVDYLNSNTRSKQVIEDAMIDRLLSNFIGEKLILAEIENFESGAFSNLDWTLDGNVIWGNEKIRKRNKIIYMSSKFKSKQNSSQNCHKVCTESSGSAETP